MPAAEASGKAIGAAEAARLLAPLGAFGHVALAVSGGADSSALLHLTTVWRDGLGRPPHITVLSVDHGLRPAAAAEAAAVAETAGLAGFAHVTLTPQPALPHGASQETCRQARYALMCEWCALNRADALVLAHTLDDQAETVLMRLARGSGVDGLSAMAARSTQFGVTILRPLLEVPRARLVATLTAAGRTWCEDPSNADERFERVRWRRALGQLEPLGLTAASLARTAQRMARARAALEAGAEAAAQACVRWSPAGYCEIAHRRLAEEPEEICLRVLENVLTAAGGRMRAPARAATERLWRAVQDQGACARTLSGCVVRARGGHLLVVREAGRRAPPPVRLSPGETALWDRRFAVHAAGAAGGPVTVCALGDAPLGDLPGHDRDAALAPAARRALVSFWRDGRLVCVPHLCAPDSDQRYSARFVAQAPAGETERGSGLTAA